MEVAGAAFPITPLLSTCTKVVTILHNVGKKFQRAPLMMTSIATECSLIHVALAQLRSFDWPSITAHADGRQEQITRSTESIILGCTLTLSVIEDYAIELQEYVEGTPLSPTEQMGIMARVRVLWKEDEMRELLLQLRGYQTGLTSLIRAAHDADFNDTQDSLTGPNSNYTLLLQRSRSSRVRKPLSIRAAIQQAATYSTIPRSSSTIQSPKSSISAVPSRPTATTTDDTSNKTSPRLNGAKGTASNGTDPYDSGVNAAPVKQVVPDGARPKQPSFLSQQPDESINVVEGKPENVKKSKDQMRKSSPTVGERFKFVPGEPPKDVLNSAAAPVSKDIADGNENDAPQTETVAEERRSVTQSPLNEPPRTSPPQIPLPAPPSRSPSRSRSPPPSSPAKSISKTTRKPELLSTSHGARRQGSISPPKLSPLRDSQSPRGSSSVADDDLDKVSTPLTPQTDFSIPPTPRSGTPQPRKQKSSSSVRDQIMVLPETARLRKQASGDILRTQSSVELLGQANSDEPVPALPSAGRDPRPIVGNAFGRQGAQSAQAYGRSVSRASSFDMLGGQQAAAEMSQASMSETATQLSLRAKRAIPRSASDARRPPHLKLTSNTTQSQKAQSPTSGVLASPQSVASSPGQPQPSTADPESWPLSAAENGLSSESSHQSTYYHSRNYLRSGESQYSHSPSRETLVLSGSLSPDLTPRASRSNTPYMGTPGQRSRSNTLRTTASDLGERDRETIEDGSSMSGSASIMSAQWYRSPRERLAMGPRVSRADMIPWELGEEEIDTRLEQTKSHFVQKPRLGDVLGVSERARNEPEPQSPPRSPLLTEGFLTNVKNQPNRRIPDTVSQPSTSSTHYHNGHEPSSPARIDKKEKEKKKKQSSRFGTLGAMYKEYKTMNEAFWSTSQYARAAEEQRQEAQARDKRPATGSTGFSGSSRANGSIDAQASRSNKSAKNTASRPSEETRASVDSSSGSSRKDAEKKKKKSGGILTMREMWKEYKTNTEQWYTSAYKEEHVRNLETPQPF